MDRSMVDKVFSEQILGRWPDFELSGVLMNDWSDLLCKFSPDDISKAAKQYVLNYSQFKKPDLFKFKEILNAQCRCSETQKTSVEKWPQYFLQCDSKDCKYWGYGTFVNFYIDTEDPGLSLKLMERQRIKQEEMYGGKWIIITAYDVSERRILINDRSLKNRTVTPATSRHKAREALSFDPQTIISTEPEQLPQN